jgi:uncharacterized protein YaaQ
MTKLILAILSADAVEPVSRALVENRYTVTQISSVGGFFRQGSTTIMIGTEETQVEKVMQIIRGVCAPLSKGAAHAATIFVLNAAQFTQI